MQQTEFALSFLPLLLLLMEVVKFIELVKKEALKEKVKSGTRRRSNRWSR